MGWERANWYAARGHGRRPTGTATGDRTGFRARPTSIAPCVRRSGSSISPRSQAPARGPRRARPCSSGSAPTTWTCRRAALVYTQMLNARGGIEADLTVTRLAADAFLVVTSASAATHNAHWIRRHLGEARAVLTDVTSSEAVLGVMGPALARAAGAAHRRRPLERGVSVSRVARDLARRGPRARRARHLRRRAGLGALRPHGVRRRRLRRRGRAPARTWGCATPAITPWTRSAWRRRTAPGGTTSAARTRRSRPGSASRCASTSGPPSSGATRSWPSARSRSSAGSSSSCSTSRSRCSITTSRSGATARWSGGSPRAPTAIPRPRRRSRLGGASRRRHRRLRGERPMGDRDRVRAAARPRPARPALRPEVAPRPRLKRPDHLAPVALGHRASLDPVCVGPAPRRQVGGAEEAVDPRQVHREVLVHRLWPRGASGESAG